MWTKARSRSTGRGPGSRLAGGEIIGLGAEESGFGCESGLVHCVMRRLCFTQCTGAFDPVQTLVWVQAQVQIPVRIRVRIRGFGSFERG